MPTIFVASSKIVQEWAGDVGLSKSIFKLGVSETSAEDAIATFNAERYAGGDDWKLVKKQKADDADEEALIARLAAKEKEIDPNYYPKIRGARGLFRIKPQNVASALLVQRALAGEPDLQASAKIKPKDIAEFMIRNALG
ncbi:MAG TPA: hypothetical protein VH835_10900 [Dongiaceae bacterium]|jgi:hypothetical protein